MNFQMLRDIIAARRRSFGFLAFLALLALAGQLYLSLWQRPELEKAQVDWFAKRDALVKGETLADSTKYQHGMRDLEELKKRLVPKKDFAAVLNQIYETAKDNSLSLGPVTYTLPKVKAGEQILPYGVSFSVTGRYGSVKSFLADLVRYREFVTVDSVSLSNKSATEEEVSLRVLTTVYLTTEGA